VTAWSAFAAVAGVVTVLLLALSHATSQRFGDPDASPSVGERVDGARGARSDASRFGRRRPPSAPVEEDRERWSDVPVDEESERSREAVLHGGREQALAGELRDAPRLSQSVLLLNVALSQGTFGVVLVVAAVLSAVPRGALGVADQHVSVPAVLVGVAFGTALYAANEVGGSVADAFGFGRGEALRGLLAPESGLGWAILLGGVLPVVAGFEELLFRGVLVGAFAAGAGVSPWLLVVPSSVLFGLGHGAQGRLGVVVTTALGAVLAVAFVLTGSLVVVVVAHYLVNALEFVVHESELVRSPD